MPAQSELLMCLLGALPSLRIEHTLRELARCCEVTALSFLWPYGVKWQLGNVIIFRLSLVFRALSTLLTKAHSVGDMPDTDAPLGRAQTSVDLQPRRIRRRIILILGVLVVPAVLSLALNSYGPLTEESALRMAAATVAGQTIAILSAVTAVVLTIKRRQSLAAIIIIAVLIVSNALNTINAAGQSLITWLDLIAEIDRVHDQ